MGTVATINATIANGASLSNAVKIGDSEVNDGSRAPADFRLFGIVMPAAWTAASLTFQASLDGGTSWHNVKDATGAEVSVVASVDDCVVWLPAAFSALPMLKVRSGTAAAPVAQGAERVITLILRSV